MKIQLEKASNLRKETREYKDWNETIDKLTKEFQHDLIISKNDADEGYDFSVTIYDDYIE